MITGQRTWKRESGQEAGQPFYFEVQGGSLYKCQPRASFLRLRSFETLLRLEKKSKGTGIRRRNFVAKSRTSLNPAMI